jgi:hypothetical protein
MAGGRIARQRAGWVVGASRRLISRSLLEIGVKGGGPMTDEQSNGGTDDGVWWIVGLCLTGAALSFLGAGIVQTYRFSGVGARERIEEIVNFGLGTVTAGLLLGAAITLRAAGARARNLSTAVMVFAVVVVGGAIFSVFDFLTIHIPGPNDTQTFTLGISQGGWKERLSAILPRVAAGLVAVAAIAVARHRDRSVEVATAE